MVMEVRGCGEHTEQIGVADRERQMALIRFEEDPSCHSTVSEQIE